jgi:hypothetical protein
VNVLVFAFREELPEHERFRSWLSELVWGPEPFGLADVVMSGFLRLVTLRRIFPVPTPLDRALEFVTALRERPNAVIVRPGNRHWQLFTGLCRTANATGNLVPDAYLAALTIESGSELVTTDRDFARFPGLRWRHPLDAT